MAKRLHSVEGERHTKGSLGVPVLIDKVQDLQTLTVIVEMLLRGFPTSSSRSWHTKVPEKLRDSKWP